MRKLRQHPLGLMPIRIVAGKAYDDGGYVRDAQPIRFVTESPTESNNSALDAYRVYDAETKYGAGARYGQNEVGEFVPVAVCYVVAANAEAVTGSDGILIETWPVIAADNSFITIPAPTWSGALTVAAAAANDTVIATLTNPQVGEVLSITPNDGKVKIVGNELRRGATAAVASVIPYTFTRTLAGAKNTPLDTAINVTFT